VAKMQGTAFSGINDTSLSRRQYAAASGRFRNVNRETARPDQNGGVKLTGM
jgi:hypothetical protein